MKGLALGIAGIVLLAGFLWRGDGGEPYVWRLPRGFPEPRVPADNPMSEAKVALGRRLFYDRRLSVTGRYSCASCHRQELAFTDGRAVAVGATGETHPRSSMSLVNVAYAGVLTWSDPGATRLEDQALTPLLGEHPVEMGLAGREAALLHDLRADALYRRMFPEAFPGAGDPFTVANVTKALAAFERSIVSARSPYDRYYFGGAAGAISESAKRGEALFFTDGVAGCYRCHGGFYFSDTAVYAGREDEPAPFHNTALFEEYAAPNRGIFEHTHRAADRGKFKAPTLRNVAVTGPYMHDGSIATLGEVLDHYAAGGRAHGNAGKDTRMTGFALTGQNRADLLAFLESLTDTEVLRDPRFSDAFAGSP